MAQISFPNRQSGAEPCFRLVSFVLLVRERVARLWESNNMFSPLQLASVNRAARRPLLLLKVALMVCMAAISSSAFARTATTTALAVTSSGVVVTSVTAGSLVTLTATVKAGTTVVKQGQVNFCDATATYCTDIHILATAQLTSSGKATYKFLPGIGSHSYKAVFVGTGSDASSTSSVASLTVTGTAGPFATVSSIAETGAWGDYTLTGTVTEAGGTVAPMGTVSFVDASNGNSVLAVGSLGAAVAGVGWRFRDRPTRMNLPRDQTAARSLCRRPHGSAFAPWSCDHAGLLEGISNFNLSPIGLDEGSSEFC
jgi:hypothetical protein